MYVYWTFRSTLQKLTRSIIFRVFTREREKMQLEKEIVMNDGVMNKYAIRNYFQWINKGRKYESTHVFLNRKPPSFSTCISLSKNCFLEKSIHEECRSEAEDAGKGKSIHAFAISNWHWWITYLHDPCNKKFKCTQFLKLDNDDVKHITNNLIFDARSCQSNNLSQQAPNVTYFSYNKIYTLCYY